MELLTRVKQSGMYLVTFNRDRKITSGRPYLKIALHTVAFFSFLVKEAANVKPPLSSLSIRVILFHQT